MTFQDWLRDEIEASQQSYTEIGKRGGISHARISQVLSGDPPGIEFCVAIAVGFNLPIDDVLKRAGYPTPNVAPKNPAAVADPALRECWRLLNGLSPQELGVVVRMLRGLAANHETSRR